MSKLPASCHVFVFSSTQDWHMLLPSQVCRRLKPDWQKACYRMAVARLALGRFEDAALAAWEVSDQQKKKT